AGAGAELGGQHHHRAFPGDVRVQVVIVQHAAVGILHLHHRARLNKQAGQVDRLGQAAAAIFTKIKNQCVHSLGFEVFQDFFDVSGGALVVGSSRALGFHVQVEARQVDI